jgi:hypothetical protein
MKFLLLIIIFNIAILGQYETPSYIFDYLEYNELELSESEVPIADVERV